MTVLDERPDILANVSLEIAEALRLLEQELLNALNSPSPEVRAGARSLVERVSSCLH